MTIRSTGKEGGLLEVGVPGAPAQRMTAMDIFFTLGAGGLITRLGGRAHHVEPSDVGEVLHPGDVPPSFTLPDVDGRDVALTQPAAIATVVAFISNHCPFSLTWHARLQSAVRDYTPLGARFLFVNANDPTQGPKDGVEHIRELVAAGHFAAPCLIDAKQQVAHRWGARRTPEVFVLNAQGAIAYHGAPGPDSADDAQDATWLRNALDRLIAGAVPDPAETEILGCPIKWKRHVDDTIAEKDG